MEEIIGAIAQESPQGARRVLIARPATSPLGLPVVLGFELLTVASLSAPARVFTGHEIRVGRSELW